MSRPRLAAPGREENKIMGTLGVGASNRKKADEKLKEWLHIVTSIILRANAEGVATIQWCRTALFIPEVQVLDLYAACVDEVYLLKAKVLKGIAVAFRRIPSLAPRAEF